MSHYFGSILWPPAFWKLPPLFWLLELENVIVPTSRLIFDGLQKVKLFGPISCYASHFFSIGCMRQVLLPSDLRVSKLVTPPGHDAV